MLAFAQAEEGNAQAVSRRFESDNRHQNLPARAGIFLVSFAFTACCCPVLSFVCYNRGGLDEQILMSSFETSIVLGNIPRHHLWRLQIKKPSEDQDRSCPTDCNEKSWHSTMERPYNLDACKTGPNHVARSPEISASFASASLEVLLQKVHPSLVFDPIWQAFDQFANICRAYEGVGVVELQCLPKPYLSPATGEHFKVKEFIRNQGLGQEMFLLSVKNMKTYDGVLRPYPLAVGKTMRETFVDVLAQSIDSGFVPVNFLTTLPLELWQEVVCFSEQIKFRNISDDFERDWSLMKAQLRACVSHRDISSNLIPQLEVCGKKVYTKKI